jgi:predicted nucleic acid-binding protein
MVFPDTSFLCSLYRRLVFTPRAIALMAERREPLAVSSLLLLEFRQSLRLPVLLHSNDRTKGFTQAEASRMLSDLKSDLRNQVFEIKAVDWAAVHQIAEELSERYTASNGHRLADILHVATALHLNVSQFLAFDQNQRTLAESEGLKVDG